MLKLNNLFLQKNKEEKMKIKKILIIEDNEDIRKALEEILKEIIGIPEIIIAKDGMEGVQKFFEYEPDVVISDLNMPQQDGYITTQKIFAISPSTPIIIASGNAIIDKRKLPASIKKVIKKPFNILELEGVLMEI